MKKPGFTLTLVLSMITTQSLMAGNSVKNTGNMGSSRRGAQQLSRQVADKGSQVNFMGLAMSAMFASQCGPQNKFACVAAGLSMIDAMASKKTRNNALTTCSHYGGNCRINTNNPNPNGNPDDTNTEQEVRQTLANNGYSLNEENGSVTTPEGNTLTSEDFKSAESLMATGVPAGQAAEAMQNIADVKTKALKKLAEKQGDQQQRGLASVSVGGDSSAGGSSGGGAFGSMGDVVVEKEIYKNKGKKKKDEGLSAEKAAQLSKTFNGQPVGIGMANLFLIVSQKYKEKRETRNQFINKEH